jgi:circadian clock protein KaiC
MVSTGIPSLDAILGPEGYPSKSAMLVEGPPGIGKEALAYWFLRSGLDNGDYCLYATHRPVSDVVRDMNGVGVSTDEAPDWMSSSGSPTKLDLRDPAGISLGIKEASHRNPNRTVRVASDVLSPLLVLNSLESSYSFWTQLIDDLKRQECVLLVLAEEGMHPPNILTTMEQVFDGVIEMRLYEQGLAITPLIRVKKMLGLPPLHGYYRFSVSSSGMEVAPHVV